MPFPHLLLALLVVIIWGLNFLFVKLCLEEMPPLLLCAMRFVLASIPAIFFIKPPAIPYRTIILYGLIMFALQFALLFMGMYAGMTPGMTALVMQVQVFFSMFFSAILLGEKPTIWQITGALISFVGISLVGTHLDKNVPPLGFLFILGAAATWGFGNLITKKTSNISMIALVVWGSFIASIPMLMLSMLFEGTQNIINSYHHLTWRGISGLLYTAFASTWVGYGVWNWLINRYPVGTVVPFTLLVPVVGITSSAVVLGEPFQSWKLVAGLFVIGGLCINLFGARLFAIKVQQEAY